ncbi:hypothetical protein OUZ56_024857 [Daphnia magna]|uniref:Uncharacterized protein n=1 Tax=Daphnia magna TaxID=35525 RepID=A0ABQ9ZI72_9CRUS|nr:hypothetical protein OUZ56_024857 [Daphnia magna]
MISSSSKLSPGHCEGLMWRQHLKLHLKAPSTTKFYRPKGARNETELVDCHKQFACRGLQKKEEKEKRGLENQRPRQLGIINWQNALFA